MLKTVLMTGVLCISAVRLVPHIALMLGSRERRTIARDLERWGEVIENRRPGSRWQRIALFVRLMTLRAEYRSLFYYRTGVAGLLLRFLCRPMSTLFIRAGKIGPGLFIQHGYCTSIGAAEIGENCWINQQVTIGFSNRTDCPTLGNDVRVGAGAKVIGKVRVGDHCTVGANAVVVKNVPSNTTVVGVPAYIVRKDGVKVRLSLSDVDWAQEAAQPDRGGPTAAVASPPNAANATSDGTFGAGSRPTRRASQSAAPAAEQPQNHQEQVHEVEV